VTKRRWLADGLRICHLTPRRLHAEYRCRLRMVSTFFSTRKLVLFLTLRPS
jgi:hypothetical protein